MPGVFGTVLGHSFLMNSREALVWDVGEFVLPLDLRVELS